MRTLKGTDFNDRSKNSLEAKKALLERFKSRDLLHPLDALLVRAQQQRLRHVRPDPGRQRRRRMHRLDRHREHGGQIGDAMQVRVHRHHPVHGIGQQPREVPRAHHAVGR